MNEKPVSYLQTDARWKNVDYSAKGETTTIGASGCGPTAMAMVLATWCDPKVDPKTECAWALKNGYKAPHSGTYYGYFAPAGKRYGLTAYQVNYTNIYGNSKSAYHAQAKDAVNGRGYNSATVTCTLAGRKKSRKSLCFKVLSYNFHRGSSSRFGGGNKCIRIKPSFFIFSHFKNTHSECFRNILWKKGIRRHKSSASRIGR